MSAHCVVWPTIFVNGWDGDAANRETIGCFPVFRLELACTKEYETDAHFWPGILVCPKGEIVDPCLRINKVARPFLEQDGFSIYFQMAVLDIDGPGHIGTDDWFNEHLRRWTKLPRAISEPMAWYRTAGGYRLLWTLADRLDPESYLHLLSRLRFECKRVGIIADELKDWNRAYRLPRVFRDGVNQRHALDLDPLKHKLQPRQLLAEKGVTNENPSFAAYMKAMAATGSKERFELPESIPVGKRNKMLTQYAGKLRFQGHDATEILKQLLIVNEERCQIPMGVAEVEGIATSISRYPVGSGGESILRLGSETEIAERVIEELMSEYGGHELVFDRGEVYRYSLGSGLWEVISKSDVRNCVYSYDGERIRAGKDRNGDPKFKPLKVRQQMAESVRKIVNDRTAKPSWFDEAPVGITCANGFLRCVRNQLVLEAFAPENRATRAVTWKYKKDCETPLFDECAATWFAGCQDAEERLECIAQHIGLALLGQGTRFHKALVMTGEGENGKSALLEIVSAIFDNDVSAIPPQLWQDQYRRAKLAGVLINLVNEMPENDVLHTETFKAIIGGDRVDARPIYEEPFSFVPKAGHIFAANSLPHLRDTSWGAWRRIVIIEFPNRIPPDKKDQDIAKRVITAEGGALFSRCLHAAERALHDGKLCVPASSEQFVKEWQVASNSVHAFIEEKCSPCTTGTPANQLYRSFKCWAESNGLRGLSHNKFGRRLKRLGIEVSERADANYWHLRVNTDVPSRLGASALTKKRNEHVN